MSETLLDFYKAIETTSAEMVQAARLADWDAVARCESTCAVLIERLKSKAAHELLDAGARAEKSHIMRRILVNDAEIRNLVEPWLAHCDTRMAESGGYLH
jgi:flagellar protein FliT